MLKYNICYDPKLEIVQQAVNLDNKVFYNNDVGTLELCLSWLEINKDIYTFLMNKDKLIGYINFLPLSLKCYNDFKKGNKKDYLISKKDIVNFSKYKTHNCLITSIVIDPDYQNTINIKTLIVGFLKKMKIFQQNHIYINKIIMDCINPKVERFIKKNLCGQFITNSLNNGKIYEICFNDIKEYLNKRILKFN